MQNTTYVRFPDVIKEQAEFLVEAGVYANMTELIREALRKFVSEQTISKTDLAVELYKKGKVSLGKAAAIAGIDYSEMQDLLYLRGIQVTQGPANIPEAKREFEKAKKLL